MITDQSRTTANSTPDATASSGVGKKQGFRRPAPRIEEEPARPVRSGDIPSAPTVERIVASCPIAGNGVNLWLFRAARSLHRLRLEPEKIEELLEEATSDCGRSMAADEIERAVRNAHPDGPYANSRLERPWPEKNLEKIEEIAGTGITLVDMLAASPTRLDPHANHTEAIIDVLFPGNPLFCAAKTKWDAVTKTRFEWQGLLATRQFIVPSPMLNRTGLTQEGKRSPRSLNNTGPRRFLIVEFDFSERDPAGRETEVAPLLRRLAANGRNLADVNAALHGHLAAFRPLALVVHSGGKSAHGWYPCGESTEEDLRRFMRYAVSLGGDPALWTRSQLVRMPDGMRDNGNRQQVLYFNPSVMGGAK